MLLVGWAAVSFGSYTTPALQENLVQTGMMSGACLPVYLMAGPLVWLRAPLRTVKRPDCSHCSHLPLAIRSDAELGRLLESLCCCTRTPRPVKRGANKTGQETRGTVWCCGVPLVSWPVFPSASPASLGKFVGRLLVRKNVSFHLP